MDKHQMVEFKTLLTDVLAYYGKDVSKFTLEVWWGGCKGFDFEQIRRAMHKHATDPDRGQFAPKVADIVRALGGTTTDRAAMAWGKVLEAMSAVGAYQDVVFDDPAIHAAVEDMGGWPKVCRTEMNELSHLQHRFQVAHRAYAERGEFDFPRRLAGARSPDHDYTSRGMPVPRPYLIGSRDQCIRVLQLGTAGGKQRIAQLAAIDIPLIAGKAPTLMGSM